MRPYFCAFMIGNTALMRRNGAVMLTSRAWRHSSAVRLGKRVDFASAALLTRMSTRPKCSTVLRTISSGSPGSVRSPRTTNAQSSNDACERTLTATDAPRSCSRAAAARPSPRAAPVMIATRPAKSFICGIFSRPAAFPRPAGKMGQVIHYEFEWDNDKARTNEQKHSVSFDEAKSCFVDVFALESFDVDHSVDEDRFVIIGTSERGRVLVVAFTLRDHRTIGIISAREALRRERLEYEKQIDS